MGVGAAMAVSFVSVFVSVFVCVGVWVVWVGVCRGGLGE